jgi:mitogen-activated protein kinase kinase
VNQDGHAANESVPPKLSLAVGQPTGSGPPKLSIATPMGSYGAPQEHSSQPQPMAARSGRPTLGQLNIGAVREQSRTRSDSFHNASVPGSASSSTYSQLSLAMGNVQKAGTPDPSSAISSVYSEAGIGGTGMEKEGSMAGLSIDFDKLSLDKGAPIDVEDLDDDAWLAASEQKRIIELGSLGEGAGGAVTRCMLQGGSTVFALKVRPNLPRKSHIKITDINVPGR